MSHAVDNQRNLASTASKDRKREIYMAESNDKEIECISNISKFLQEHSNISKKECSLKGLKDLQELINITTSLQDEDALQLIAMESVMGVICKNTRKQVLRDRQMNKLTTEEDISNILQNHRDEFMQFVWKRRVQSKKDLSALFQSGSTILSRFGDMISDSSLEGIQRFERRNRARLCNDGIQSDFLTNDDFAVFFTYKVFLIRPFVSNVIRVTSNRLEIDQINSDLAISGQKWVCVYGSDAVWTSRLLSKPLTRDVVIRTYSQLRAKVEQLSEQKMDTLSYIHFLARIIDLAHPSQKLQTAVMAFPLHAVQTVKRRLLSLGYSLGQTTEDSAILDGNMAIDYIKQINKRLDTEHRFYFEFLSPHRVAWRVGLTTACTSYSIEDLCKYPGMDSESFGICSDGYVFFDGIKYKYIDDPQDAHAREGFRTWGIVIDLYYGYISLVFDGNVQDPAFGAGANHFNSATQRQQRKLILKSPLYPMLSFSVLAKVSPQSSIKVNFGDRLFSYAVNAVSFNSVIQYPSTPKELSRIFEEDDAKLKSLKEEDEKLQLSIEKNFLRNAIMGESLKSFSQFPPSAYRRSYACTRIQRAWRRYRGRKIRAAIRKEQNDAATIIQRAARRKLKSLRRKKNIAAFKIQKAWRRKLFIRKALIRCIYRKPLRLLHKSASIIQAKYKMWKMFRNSPIAAKYNLPIEVLKEKVKLIVDWWRPLHIKRQERLKVQRKYNAATLIQKTWRGVFLRRLLRSDVRDKLLKVGHAVAKYRTQLLGIHGAYVRENAKKKQEAKLVKSTKIKIQNLAAFKIQAAFKGYWTRAHISLRFNYGQTVYLNAVTRGLRHAHFILKMYRPCGIVCPKN